MLILNDIFSVEECNIFLAIYRIFPVILLLKAVISDKSCGFPRWFLLEYSWNMCFTIVAKQSALVNTLHYISDVHYSVFNTIYQG